MKTAFSIWEDRIAPVFDTAAHLVVAEVKVGQFSKEERVLIPTDDRGRQAARLAELGVTTLVCGAVARDLQDFLVARGIRLLPFVAGDLRTVMDAWREGRLNSAAFTVVDNAQNLSASQGAGIQSAQTVAATGAQALISGHCGPKAFRVLGAAGIAVHTSDAATVKEALEQFRAGKLQALRDADVDGHWA